MYSDIDLGSSKALNNVPIKNNLCHMTTHTEFIHTQICISATIPKCGDRLKGEVCRFFF